MKLLLLVLLTAILIGQERPIGKVHSFKFDDETHRLSYVISSGRMEGDRYVPVSMQELEVDLEAMTVKAGESVLPFTDMDEQQRVLRTAHALLNYGAECHLWHERGGEQPPTGPVGLARLASSKVIFATK